MAGWTAGDCQALARTWKLHKTYPSGPREFWESHGDMLTLTETLASHAKLFGDPSSGKAPFAPNAVRSKSPPTLRGTVSVGWVCCSS